MKIKENFDLKKLEFYGFENTFKDIWVKKYQCINDDHKSKLEIIIKARKVSLNYVNEWEDDGEIVDDMFEVDDIFNDLMTLVRGGIVE